MAIIDLFSKRRKKEQQGQDDVYQYTDLPREFRVQVVLLLKEALGAWDYSNYQSYDPNEWWTDIHNAVAREKGVFRLSVDGVNGFEHCANFLLICSTDDALDLIEFALRYIDRVLRRWPMSRLEYLRSVFKLRLARPDDVIEELNGRFKEHRIGYFYADGVIGRVDSQYLHVETIQPALRLLQHQREFEGPLQEFLTAHECHRQGNQKEAISSALKAFESTMKAICDQRQWAYDPSKDTANKLIQVVFAQGLIPEYLQNHFTGLRAVLEAGVPTVRNRTSGHGQGATPTSVPDWLAAYVLHQTAANIVLLVKAHQAKQ